MVNQCLTEEARAYSEVKISLFNKWGWEIGQVCAKKRKKPDHLLTPHTRINPKWIKDLTVRLKATKTLEKNTGSKILGISHSNIFSAMSPQARETKEKNKQMGPHPTKKLSHSKGNHQPKEKTAH